MAEINFEDKIINSLLDVLPVGVILVDNNSEVVMCNLKALDLMGYEQAELKGQHISRMIPERYRADHKIAMLGFMAMPTSKAMGHGRVLPALTKDGVEIEVEIGMTPMAIDGKEYVVVSMIETTNQILKVAAFNDPLTGLPNRNLFKEKSESMLELAIRDRKYIAIMFIDLDEFKAVNDHFGHDIGDIVLCKVADILRASTRKNDIVGRIGGDEFVMCLYGIKNKSAVNTIASHLIKEIMTIKRVTGHQIDVSASIGVVLSDDESQMQINEMVRRSDRLMYDAKKEGRGNIVIKEL